jgi:hypothetical protein
MTNAIRKFFSREPRPSSEEREYQRAKIELADERLRLQDARLDAQARELEYTHERRRLSPLRVASGRRLTDP